MGKVAGHEYPTLAERVIGLFRLPYLIGCGLFILLFSLAAPLDSYLESFNFGKAVTQWLADWQTPGGVLFFLLFAYIFYAPHYMRRKLLRAEDSTSPLLPNGEEDFHKLFGSVSGLKPQLIVWAIFFATIFLLPSPQEEPRYRFGLVSSLSFSVLFTLGVSSVVWTYFSSLRGIHRMGGSSLHLRPYYKDRLLGLRPVGSLALSLVVAYFGFIALISMLTAFSGEAFLGPYVFLSGLIILGLLIFFLPLRKLHQLMLQQKKLEKEKLEQKLTQIFENPTEANPPSALTQALILDTLRLDMMKREISSIAVWPVDTQILGRLITVILTVIAILVAAALRTFLHF